MSIFKEGLPVGIACDHAGYDLKLYIISVLEAMGVTVRDFGTHSPESCDYADYAHPLALAVERGEVYPGIAMCGSGNGINMTLNKHQGVRAALCWEPELARLARAHNNANVLVMPARFVSEKTARKMLEEFVSTDFEGGRHERRVAKIPVAGRTC